jgi:hypothetical protein
MIITYCIVAAVLVVIGFFVMCVYMNEEVIDRDDFRLWIRTVAVFTLGSWVVALLWPVLLVSVLPVLLVYGMVVAVKGVKHKTLDY